MCTITDRQLQLTLLHFLHLELIQVQQPALQNVGEANCLLATVFPAIASCGLAVSGCFKEEPQTGAGRRGKRREGTKERMESVFDRIKPVYR